MKKNFMSVLMLLFSGFLTAQTQQHEFEITQGPEDIVSATENAMFIKGVSENGKYCWGNNTKAAYYYNTETGEYALFTITPEQKKKGYKDTSKIAGITNDGVAIVCIGLREAYALNIATGEKTMIESPFTDFPYIHIWDMSADARIAVGNCTNKKDHQRPIYAERQPDGTYKVTALDYEDVDAMGAKPQFTQVRTVTSDGKYFAGPQVNENGFASRFIVWSPDGNGGYTYTYPFDEIIYDLTKEKPGAMPNESDYVTSTDPYSDEYKQQIAAYDKAYEEWAIKFDAFTKGGLTVTWSDMSHTLTNKYFCGSTQKSIGYKKERVTPMFYEYETGSVIHIDTLKENHKALDVLPDNSFITLTAPNRNWFKIMITENNVTRPFHEWIKEKSGKDISDFYLEDYFAAGETYSDVFMGRPCFSADGKTLVLTRVANHKYVTSIIKFSNSIFGNCPTGIKAEIVDEFEIKGSEINAKNALVEVYTFDGCKVKSLNVSGSVDLANKLNTGSYIVKISEGNNIRSYKLILN